MRYNILITSRHNFYIYNNNNNYNNNNSFFIWPGKIQYDSTYNLHLVYIIYISQIYQLGRYFLIKNAMNRGQCYF